MTVACCFKVGVLSELTLWVCLELCSSSEPVDETDMVRQLRERRPNASNKGELLRLMDETRPDRRQWITDHMPTITDILRKYPRLQDIEDAVSNSTLFSLPNFTLAYMSVSCMNECLGNAMVSLTVMSLTSHLWEPAYCCFVNKYSNNFMTFWAAIQTRKSAFANRLNVSWCSICDLWWPQSGSSVIKHWIGKDRHAFWSF